MKNKSIKAFLQVTLVSSFLISCASYTPVNGINMAKDKQDDMLSQANQFYVSREYSKAADIYNKVIDDNSSAETLLQYAESLRHLNKCSEAITIYNKILKADSGNLDASEGVGLCHVLQGEFQDAAEVLSNVVKVDETRWKSINALGVIYALKGHMDESMEYYNLAIKNSGKNPTVLNNVGLSLAFGGRYQMGRKIMERSLLYVKDFEDKKRKDIELNLALIYGLAGETQLAKMLLEKHLTQAQVMNNLGFYARLADDKKLAKVYLSKALSISPTHYEKAWNNLQDIKQEQDKDKNQLN